MKITATLIAMLCLTACLRAENQSAEPLEKLRTRTETLVKETEELRKSGKLVEARSRLQGLALLGLCPVARSLQIPEAKLLDAITSINQELTEKWSKQEPALNKKNDLVFRNKSISDIVAEISAAAGLKCQFVAGSNEDVCEILHDPNFKVHWLDVRGVSVAQALDWLTQLTRLEWRFDENVVVVGSARLQKGTSAWVYEVSRIVRPAELYVDGKNNADQELFIKATTQFFDGVTSTLGVQEEDIHWLAPGQLLIWGSRTTHTNARKLFQDLANPEAKLDDKLAGLHALKRSKLNHDACEAALHLLAQKRIAEAFSIYTWRLLAAAADKKLDLEALTELQAAWASPQIENFVKGEGFTLAARAAFAITQSAQVLKENTELAQLAKVVVEAIKPVAEAKLKTFASNPEGAHQVLIYAALCLNEIGFTAQTTKGLSREYLFSSPSPSFYNGAIVMALLDKPMKAKDVEALLSDTKPLMGEDWVVLAALACRRSGNEGWALWRTQAEKLLGQRQLSGSAIVLINHLDRGLLPMLKQ